MKRISIMLAAPLICALNAFAQNQKSEAVRDWIDQWNISTDQLIRVAEAMPAEKYDYKPVKEVGAFGEQLKHAGTAMRILLANAEGKKVEIKDVTLDRLKTKSKAARLKTVEFSPVSKSLRAAKAYLQFFYRTATYVYIFNPDCFIPLRRNL